MVESLKATQRTRTQYATDGTGYVNDLALFLKVLEALDGVLQLPCSDQGRTLKSYKICWDIKISSLLPDTSHPQIAQQPGLL